MCGDIRFVLNILIIRNPSSQKFFPISKASLYFEPAMEKPANPALLIGCLK